MSRLAKARARLATALFRAGRALTGQVRSTYAGAAANRLMADWIFGPVSAQYELLDLRTLRDRGRELERDNAYAGRYVELCAENIISDSGIRLQALNYRNDDLDETVNDEIERAWAEFCLRENGDATGTRDMIDLQVAVVEAWKGGDGEALIQLLPGTGPHGIQWLLLDADQLDETYWRARANVDRDGPDVNAIIAGVEVDRKGKPVAYHLFTEHPNNVTGTRKRERIAAEYIIHIFTPRRAGQTRGLTRFARVMKALRHLGGLNEAVLVNMRASACKMGFLQPNEGAEPLQGPDGQAKISLEATPGSIDVIPPGYTFADWNPHQPSASHREVVHEALYEISAGLGVSFASLTGNLTGANYGSQRGGSLSERRGWRRDQRFVARHLMSRLFSAWLPMAALTNKVKLPSQNVSRYLAHEWLVPGWDWIDPQKDVNAGLTEVRAGLTSLTALAAAKGRELEVVLAQRMKEMKIAKKYGVTIDLTSAGQTPQGATNASASNGDAAEGNGSASEDESGDGNRDRAVTLRLASGG